MVFISKIKYLLPILVLSACSALPIRTEPVLKGGGGPTGGGGGFNTNATFGTNATLGPGLTIVPSSSGTACISLRDNSENDGICESGTNITSFQNNGATTLSVFPTALAGYVLADNAIGAQPDALVNLPTCNTNTEGLIANANNCNAACVMGGTCTAGGTTHCEEFCNGTSWIETGMGGTVTYWMGASASSVSASAAAFWPIFGMVGSQPTNEGQTVLMVGSPATISQLRCELTSAAGTPTVAGGTGTGYALVLRKNLANTALTCTIGAAQSACTDLSDSVSVTTNDLVDMMDTPNGTPTALIPKCTVRVIQ